MTHDLLWSVRIYLSSMCEINDKCQICGAWDNHGEEKEKHRNETERVEMGTMNEIWESN